MSNSPSTSCSCCHLKLQVHGLSDQLAAMTLQLTAAIKRLDAVPVNLDQGPPPENYKRAVRRKRERYFKWLTDERAQRILELCVLGLTNEEISTEVGVSHASCSRVRAGSRFIPAGIQEFRTEWLKKHPHADLWPLRRVDDKGDR